MVGSPYFHRVVSRSADRVVLGLLSQEYSLSCQQNSGIYARVVIQGLHKGFCSLDKAKRTRTSQHFIAVWDLGGEKKKRRDTAQVPCALDACDSCLAHTDEKPAVGERLVLKRSTVNMAAKSLCKKVHNTLLYT